MKKKCIALFCILYETRVSARTSRTRERDMNTNTPLLADKRAAPNTTVPSLSVVHSKRLWTACVIVYPRAERAHVLTSRSRAQC